jgi:hypothetical protein
MVTTLSLFREPSNLILKGRWDRLLPEKVSGTLI